MIHIRGMAMNFEEAKLKLEKYGQSHVLDYYDELTPEQKEALLTQIDETDLSVIRYAANPHGNQERGKISPLGAMEIPEIEKNRERFEKAGLEALRAGKIGAVLLAGGMGTRLGSDLHHDQRQEPRQDCPFHGGEGLFWLR